MANVHEKLIGSRYSLLTITDVFDRDRHGNLKIQARCDCGVLKNYFLSNLIRIHTTSCGCMKIKKAGDAVRTHGFSRKHPLYKCWDTMKGRCYNKKSSDYQNYGGRGVTVCELWKNNFLAYYNWAIENGWELGLNIDKDIKGGLLYSPETCSVVSSKENQNSRRNNILIEYEGNVCSLKQISDKTGIKYSLLYKRYVKYGWDISKAISTQVKEFKSP